VPPGLEVTAYRAPLELSADHAVTAPAYSEVHSVMAKQRAPGRKRVEDGDTSSARQARPKRKRLSAAGSLTT